MEPLRGHDMLGKVSAIFYKWDKFGGFMFAFLHINPFWKEVHSRRKEFAQKGGKNNSDKSCFPWSVSIPLKF